MNFEDLTPTQQKMVGEIAEHLYSKYATSNPQSFVDAAKALEFVNYVFQDELQNTKANPHG